LGVILQGQAKIHCLATGLIPSASSVYRISRTRTLPVELANVPIATPLTEAYLVKHYHCSACPDIIWGTAFPKTNILGNGVPHVPCRLHHWVSPREILWNSTLLYVHFNALFYIARTV